MAFNSAVIDLGTNTFNLLIIRKHEEGFEIIFKTREPVKLGEGGMKNGMIAPEAFKRGTETLRRYNQIIEEHHCDKVFAFATSAIRSTSNGGDFVEAVKRKLGIHIEVIEGDREAELIWKGVRQVVDLKGTHLLMDIGGGSTEFILGNADEIFFAHSFQLGVSRLFEHLSPSDPITPDEIASAKAFLQKELSPLFEAFKKHPALTMVGSSGSFATFAQMFAHSKGEIDAFWQKTSYPIPMEPFLKIYDQLVQSTLEERFKMDGIEEFRAKFIVLGTLLTKVIIDELGIENLVYSVYNMKEGIVSELVS